MTNLCLPILLDIHGVVCLWITLGATIPIVTRLLEITVNWDALSAIGETLGAVAVVVSLVYVGRQLKQNSAMMRNASATEVLEIDHTIVLPIIESEEFAEIWLKGDHRLNELSEANLQRLILFERRAIVLWHHHFQQHRQNFVSDEMWYYTSGIIQFLSLREAVRVAWSIFRNHYEPSFQEYIDEQFRLAREAAGE